ncbi:MAG: hypothetical protein J6J12_07675 [Oscillospiraceae bacterium]|nr:hypothetical protein [Oscillospiraceae bacterium]
MEIREQEKRRASNLIWNAAQDYDFEPDFKAYDEEGQADLYWNSIIGAVRKNYGAQPMEQLFSALKGSENEVLYEQLIWLGLEHAVYQREKSLRPALPSLRRSYAQRVIASVQRANLLEILEEAHFRRALGEDPVLTPWDRKMLDALQFPPEWDAETVSAQALELLHQWFGFVPVEGQGKRVKKYGLFRSQRKEELFDPTPIRRFGRGYSEHVTAAGHDQAGPARRVITDKSAEQTEALLIKHISSYFGQPLYDERTTAQLERELCVDNHKNCRLYYAIGSAEYDRKLKGHYAKRRKAALKQMAANRAAYEADALRHRNSILRLTARIRNAMMAYLQPTVSPSASGTLDAGRVWRGVQLDDDKVFTRILQSDPGDLCVDILLDASYSQVSRQELVSAQGYMIAEALTRCNIPVRVSAFCSISGYTIMTRYRDYFERDKNDHIFHFFTAGCNRDGLALRMLCREMESAPCEHKILILLSDARPNDIIKFSLNGQFVDYVGDNGVLNTATEVRSLQHRGISVICVFTGDDDDVPSAHTIYGRNFARIRHLEQFADTVGTLIQNQIRSL